MSQVGILEELQSEVDCWMDGWPERGSEERTADRLIDVCLRFPRPDSPPLPPPFPTRPNARGPLSKALLPTTCLYRTPAQTASLSEPIHQ